VRRRGGLIAVRRLPVTGNRDDLVIGTYKPDATTTGVLPGTTLIDANSNADLVATDGTSGMVAGKTYQNYRFNYFITPPNASGSLRITFKNCWFAGQNSVPPDFVGLAKLYNANHVPCDFIDCTFRPQRPSRLWNGIHGYGFTALRCDLSYLVDPFSIFNSTAGQQANLAVEIRQCYVHDFTMWNQGTGDIGPPNGAGENSFDGSHNDGVQQQSGNGFIFWGNHINGFNAPGYLNTYYNAYYINAPLTLQDQVGPTTGSDIQYNWLYGGAVQINITGALRNYGTIKRNVFGRDTRTGKNILRKIGMTLDTGTNGVDGNVYDDGSMTQYNPAGSPVPVSNG
jgi:hypothetical protein